MSDLSPLGKHLDLIKEIMPDAKRVGVIYNPGEANSVALVEALQQGRAGRRPRVVEAAAARTVDVPSAAQSLVGKADAIYVPTDNTVVSALEGIVKVAQQAKLPVFAADTDAVPRGAIAALGFNYYDLGRQTGKMVVRVLKGEAPGAIASQVSEHLSCTSTRRRRRSRASRCPRSCVKSAKVVVK